MHRGSAIVIAHNSAEHIERCLLALSRIAGWEILLVDNASTDNTLQLARKFADTVHIVAEYENLGFAGAVNKALRMATSDVVVILNPDAVPEPGALDCLAAAIANPKIGAAGGLLLDEHSKVQRGFVMRRFPTLAYMLCETLLLNRLWPLNPWNRHYRCLDANYDRQQVVDQPAGAALAFRREVWQVVGGFDEQFYPVWFEDVDFCRRITDQGWELLYEPSATFSHVGAHSVSKLSYSDRQLFWYRNLLRYFHKHHGWLESLMLRAAILVGAWIRTVLVMAGMGPRFVTRAEALRAFALVLRTVIT
jgi:GT2 family glycosyltransferase